MLDSLNHDQPEIKRRRLPDQVVTALDVIALMSQRVLRWHEFELRMHQRGCDARACLTALACLERRNWATRNGGLLSVTDTGYAAAVRGAKSAPVKQPTPKIKHRRLPLGMFG